MEKNRAKVRHKRKKPHILTRNTVVYNCHFCSNRNLKRGTPKGHMAEMYPSKLKASSIPKAVESRLEKYTASSGKETRKGELNYVHFVSSSAVAAENPTTASTVTPLVRGRTSLDGNKRNKSGSKIPTECENNPMTPNAKEIVGASSKRRRKSWASLRDIVQSGNIPSAGIPFLL